MILDNRNFAIAVLQQAAHRLSDASGSNAALRAHLANMEWRVRIGEDLRMGQRGYGRGYCAVVERSRGVGYRWVPVDSLGKWKLGVEGRWKEGRTYAHCWAGLTASLECVRWTRATLPVSDSWRQSARRGLRREGALRAVDPAGSSLTDAEWGQTRMLRTRLVFGRVRL